ncbi:hypothetical protein [Rhizobium sp. SSA_523]|uniref:hypothetical protein n=1 Tax=Rhizobium sp. SSA_523 TaxID=2952477 RepID=UPI00209050E5|nr:hypothetical protein [Rhizobium sp. SSA_523]MCO5734023.1 hypothetical protein [Rhizobium sp. SSA_523]WKC24665.1 hypothetical protein QTJ18_11545 [Rhizobium sp. SSA_523]
MTSAEQTVQKALAAVAAARALREREAAERRQTFQRIEIASRKPLYVPKGVQLSLELN